MVKDKKVRYSWFPALIVLLYAMSAFAVQHFTFQNGKMYAPDGWEFIPKGANIQGMNQCWEGDPAEHIDKYIDCWKFNFARMYMRLYPSSCTWAGHTKEEAFNAIDKFTARKIVVMTEFHDFTGSYYTGTHLDSLLKFSKAMVERYKNNPYVWFEPMNEPGGSTTDLTKWLAVHQSYIKMVRDEVGAENPVFVSGTKWGQDGGGIVSNSVLCQNGSKVITFNNKTYKNIGFTFHVYDQWKSTSPSASKIYIVELKKKAPVIVGEFGVDNNGSSVLQALKNIWPSIQETKVGWAVWSWFGGDKNILTTGTINGTKHGWNIDDCTNPTNLSYLGQLVWDNAHRQETLERLPGVSTVQPTARRSSDFVRFQGMNPITVSFTANQSYSITIVASDGRRVSTVSGAGMSAKVPTQRLMPGVYVINVNAGDKEFSNSFLIR